MVLGGAVVLRSGEMGSGQVDLFSLFLSFRSQRLLAREEQAQEMNPGLRFFSGLWCSGLQRIGRSPVESRPEA